MVISFFSLDIDSCSFPLLIKSVPNPGIIPWDPQRIIDSISQCLLKVKDILLHARISGSHDIDTYHNLSKRSHLHNVLKLLIHVPECELTCRAQIIGHLSFHPKCSAGFTNPVSSLSPCLSLSISSSLSSSFSSLTLSISPSISPIPDRKMY